MTTGERALLHRLAIAILMVPVGENVERNPRVKKKLLLISQMALLGMFSDDFMSRFFGFIACIRQYDEQFLAMLEIVDGEAHIRLTGHDRKLPQISIVDRRGRYRMNLINKAIDSIEIVEVQDAA
ncbi:TPA: hypothetical protein QDZ84_003939 [Shewanella algae]|uniref:hypothetical protein n=1 Tax=Shewanella TaxID=22 RepID=UPI0005EC7C5D|nr:MULTISPECIES: hypothetical protein [Shewanella]MCE9773563.1 hypothetical protein [Shewanella algae]NJI84778.1 hypothetical protein [Shewanella sp. Iso12]TVK95344.1 hypothetical protein AYJ01_00730 [Shewanella algae]HDS1208887.1 hypothetical protein [Shewanella algae]